MLALAVTAKRPRLAAEARARAEMWELPFIEPPARGGLAAVLATARAVLALGGDGWRLADAHGELRFSPGLAVVRVKRLQQGVQQNDALVQLGELAAGDTVIDATLGGAADALVCAHVVGSTGRVIGFEASRPLFLLAAEGLRSLRLSPHACLVEPRFGDAGELLATWPPRSVDCVMFDVMFERPVRSAPSFQLLRHHAVSGPLSPHTLELARRVARRWVIIKAPAHGHALRRLGLSPEPRTRRALEWARVAPA